MGGLNISVNRHLNQLYPFMGVEKTEPLEQIQDLVKDGAAGTLAPETATQLPKMNWQINCCHLCSYKQQEPNLAFTYL